MRTAMILMVLSALLRPGTALAPQSEYAQRIELPASISVWGVLYGVMPEAIAVPEVLLGRSLLPVSGECRFKNLVTSGTIYLGTATAAGNTGRKQAHLWARDQAGELIDRTCLDCRRVVEVQVSVIDNQIVSINPGSSMNSVNRRGLRYLKAALATRRVMTSLDPSLSNLYSLTRSSFKEVAIM